MNTKTTLLNELFKEWEMSILEYKGKFIKDGIINEQLYQNSIPKVLFITKEPNDPAQQAWDFREWWLENLKYKFSYRIAEWSYGIQNNFPEYDNIWKGNKRTQLAIQKIALMNIKKSGGCGISECSMMIKHAEINRSFLQRQIDIICPDIIILGTSWNGLRDTIFPDVNWSGSGYDVLIGRYNHSKIIDFYHPSSRTPPAAAYSLLQNIIQSNNFKNL